MWSGFCDDKNFLILWKDFVNIIICKSKFVLESPEETKLVNKTSFCVRNHETRKKTEVSWNYWKVLLVPQNNKKTEKSLWSSKQKREKNSSICRELIDRSKVHKHVSCNFFFAQEKPTKTFVVLYHRVEKGPSK